MANKNRQRSQRFGQTSQIQSASSILGIGAVCVLLVLSTWGCSASKTPKGPRPLGERPAQSENGGQQKGGSGQADDGSQGSGGGPKGDKGSEAGGATSPHPLIAVHNEPMKKAEAFIQSWIKTQHEYQDLLKEVCSEFECTSRQEWQSDVVGIRQEDQGPFVFDVLSTQVIKVAFSRSDDFEGEPLATGKAFSVLTQLALVDGEFEIRSSHVVPWEALSGVQLDPDPKLRAHKKAEPSWPEERDLGSWNDKYARRATKIFQSLHEQKINEMAECLALPARTQYMYSYWMGGFTAKFRYLVSQSFICDHSSEKPTRYEQLSALIPMKASDYGSVDAADDGPVELDFKQLNTR